MKLKIIEGDLLQQNMEVIVNAWNRNIIPWWLLLPQGVSRAIKKQGGTKPFKELSALGPIELRGARLTGSGNRGKDFSLKVMLNAFSQINNNANVVIVKFKKG